MVDRIIEHEEFLLRVRRLMATYVGAGIEGSEQVVQKQLISRNFNPTESSAATQSKQEMHASIKVFLETSFASYLWLGELDLVGSTSSVWILRQKSVLRWATCGTIDLLLLLLTTNFLFFPKPYCLTRLVYLWPYIVFM